MLQCEHQRQWRAIAPHSPDEIRPFTAIKDRSENLGPVDHALAERTQVVADDPRSQPRIARSILIRSGEREISQYLLNERGERGRRAVGPKNRSGRLGRGCVEIAVHKFNLWVHADRRKDAAGHRIKRRLGEFPLIA
jgi:hypothetical protein